jgi:hypothetical protein
MKTNKETVKLLLCYSKSCNHKLKLQIVILQITENLNFHQEERGDISFLKNAFPRKFPGIKTIPTTETEIKTVWFQERNIH